MNDVRDPFRGPDEEVPAEQPRQNRAINVPAAVLWFIVALVAIHGLRQAIGPRLDEWVLFTFAFIPARFAPPPELANFVFPGPAAARWWSFLTHMLLHGDWMHVIINSVWMLAFGSVLARRLGAVRFLAVSAISAAAGAAANLALHWGGELTLLIGASGAVSGQLAGAVRLMFAEGGSLATLGRQRFERVRALSLGETLRSPGALMFLGVWFAITIFAGAVNFGPPGEEARIAWEAHVGGFLAGLVFFGLFDRGPRG
jgi:membrane associated rhomboid family serine protease